MTGSYNQSGRHENTSARYNVITPSEVGAVFAEKGLKIVSIKSGQAKHQDKANFQRTLSRYRGEEILDGIHLDIIHDSKHLARGCDKLMVGIFRTVCLNGLITGSKFFECAVRHSGNTRNNLSLGIDNALAMREKLADTIRLMLDIQLPPMQMLLYASRVAAKLVPSNAVGVRYEMLLSTRRDADYSTDVFTVLNRVQENVTRGHLAYSLPTKKGTLRTTTLRPLKPDTRKSLDVNQDLFNMAMEEMK